MRDVSSSFNPYTDNRYTQTTMKTILVKNDENHISLRGVSLKTDTFVSYMGDLGFDPFFTRRTLKMLNIGGKWVLDLNDKQLKFLHKRFTPSKGGGFGFLN